MPPPFGEYFRFQPWSGFGLEQGSGCTNTLPVHRQDEGVDGCSRICDGNGWSGDWIRTIEMALSPMWASQACPWYVTLGRYLISTSVQSNSKNSHSSVPIIRLELGSAAPSFTSPRHPPPPCRPTTI